MNQSDIRKSHEATAKNKNYSRHGVSIRFFEQMPERLNNAVMFIKNKNGTTVITDYQMNDRGGEKSYVVAGIWHNQKMESDTVNQVKSIYPFEDFKSQILSAAKNGMLVITDKKKAQAMLVTIGVQPSEVSRLFELSKGSITQAAADVNDLSRNNDVRYSLKNINRNEVDKEKKKGNNKKRNYNEADTLFMQWSNSPSIPVGELKMFKRGNEWVWFEKSEDGCVELFRNKNKEVVLEYERTYSKANNKIHGNSESIRTDQGRGNWNMHIPRDRGNDDRNVRQTGSERLQTDTEGNREHLRSGVRGISDITDTDTKSSLRHSLGIIDENPANQSLIAQNEAFRRIISLDSRYDVALVCAALGYKIYVLPLCPYFRCSLDLGEDNMFFAVLLCLIPDYKNVKNIIV